MNLITLGNTTHLARQFLRKLPNLQATGVLSNEVTILTVNFEDDLTENNILQISQVFDKKEAVLFLENSKNSHFPKEALLSTDAELCIIHSSFSGRRQHLFVSGIKKQPEITPPSKENVKGEKALEFPLTSDKSILNQLPEIDNFSMSSSTQEEILIGGIEWLRKIRTIQSSKDIQQINASLIRGSITVAQSKNYTTKFNGTNASIYYSYDIEVAAVVEPKKNKIIKVTSVGAYVSITDGLTKNTEDDRGDATYSGLMAFYPGDKYTFKKSEINLPKNWRIIKIAPFTPNSDNQYTRTTGWTIGAEGGGEISKDPKVAAKLSASYSKSDSYTQSFKDFSALNTSNAAYCYWEYVFTKVYNNWESIFSDWMKDIEEFPFLAKNTMYLKNEVVYEAPASDNSRQCFCNYIGQNVMYAHSHANWIGVIEYGIKYDWTGLWDYFYINLDSVIFPVE